MNQYGIIICLLIIVAFFSGNRTWIPAIVGIYALYHLSHGVIGGSLEKEDKPENNPDTTQWLPEAKNYKWWCGKCKQAREIGDETCGINSCTEPRPAIAPNDVSYEEYSTVIALMEKEKKEAAERKIYEASPEYVRDMKIKKEESDQLEQTRIERLPFGFWYTPKKSKWGCDCSDFNDATNEECLKKLHRRPN